MTNVYRLIQITSVASIPRSELLAEVDTLSLVLAIPFGVIIGILINLFADTLPKKQPLTWPVCPACHQPYEWKTYFLTLKCANCGHKRSYRSVIVLLGSIICCIFLLFYPFSNFSFWATLPILLFLGIVIVIDTEHHIVLMQTSLIGFILFSIYGTFLHGVLNTMTGALAGFLITTSFFLLGIVFTKFIGKLRKKQISEVAFGFGDVFVGTFLGLLTGWPSIVGAIVIAILTFTLYSLVFILVLILSKRYRAFANPQAFTPFLILGLIILAYL